MTENTLTTDEVRQADRIVFECLDHWSDPVDWQQHLLKEMAELLKMRVGVNIELDTLELGKIPKVLSAVEYGWEEPDRDPLAGYRVHPRANGRCMKQTRLSV